jgi:hypothetical protein
VLRAAPAHLTERERAIRLILDAAHLHARLSLLYCRVLHDSARRDRLSTLHQRAEARLERRIRQAPL